MFRQLQPFSLLPIVSASSNAPPSGQAPPPILSLSQRFVVWSSAFQDVYGYPVDHRDLAPLPHQMALSDAMDAEPGSYPCGYGKLNYLSFGQSLSVSQTATSSRSVQFASLKESLASWEKDTEHLSAASLANRLLMKLRTVSFLESRTRLLTELRAPSRDRSSIAPLLR